MAEEFNRLRLRPYELNLFDALWAGALLQKVEADMQLLRVERPVTELSRTFLMSTNGNKRLTRNPHARQKHRMFHTLTDAAPADCSAGGRRITRIRRSMRA